MVSKSLISVQEKGYKMTLTEHLVQLKKSAESLKMFF